MANRTTRGQSADKGTVRQGTAKKKTSGVDRRSLSAKLSEQPEFSPAEQFIAACRDYMCDVLGHLADLCDAIDADVANVSLRSAWNSYRWGQSAMPDWAAGAVYKSLMAAVSGLPTKLIDELHFVEVRSGVPQRNESIWFVCGQVRHLLTQLLDAVSSGLTRPSWQTIAEHPSYWLILSSIEYVESADLLGPLVCKRPRRPSRDEAVRRLLWLLQDGLKTSSFEDLNRCLPPYVAALNERTSIIRKAKGRTEAIDARTESDIIFVARELWAWYLGEARVHCRELFPDLEILLPSEPGLLEAVADIDDRITRYRALGTRIAIGLIGVPAPDQPVYSPWIRRPDMVRLMDLNDVGGTGERNITRKKSDWRAEDQPHSGSRVWRFNLHYLDAIGIKYPPEWRPASTNPP